MNSIAHRFMKDNTEESRRAKLNEEYIAKRNRQMEELEVSRERIRKEKEAEIKRALDKQLEVKRALEEKEKAEKKSIADHI